MSVSGVARMNIAAQSDEDLIRLRGVMLIGIAVDPDPAMVAKGRETLEAIDEELMLRVREP